MKKYPPSIHDLFPLDNNGGIFFIHSPERYVLKKIKDELRDYSEKNKIDIFMFDMSDGSKILSEAINTAREISFFSMKKIVVLELAEKLNDKDRDILESYIDNCETLNHLFVLVTEIDKRTKFFKNLQKMDRIYKTVPAAGTRDIEKFVTDCFAPLVVDNDLLNFFVNSGGSDLFFINAEIQKIKLYALSKEIKGTIRYSDVDEMINGLSEEAIFRIMDLLTTGKKVKALKFYRHSILTEGEYKVNPLIISMFFRHFKALMKGRILIKENKVSEFFSYLTRNRLFYLKNDAVVTAGRYKNRTVLNALHELSRIELGMKGAEGVNITDTCVEIEQFMANYF